MEAQHFDIMACQPVGATLPALRVPARQSSGRLTDSPASMLGKRDAEGFTKRGSSRTPSRYRGVTHHVRTSRYESHIWLNSKQMYLGGYYCEEVAALAYDIAAVKLRGSEAVTNFELEHYQGELEGAEQVSTDFVVQCLRNQSKAMNKLDVAGAADSAGVHMEPWELAISEALQQDKFEHLGVYESEAAAARAVDRAHIQRRGIEAVTNFPLVEYVDMLAPCQVEEAVARGLLPPTLPLNFAPSPVPKPLYTLHPRPLAPCNTAAPGAAAAAAAAAAVVLPLAVAVPASAVLACTHAAPAAPVSPVSTQTCSTGTTASPSGSCGLGPAAAAEAMAAPAVAGAGAEGPTAVPAVLRKSSVTPRSVLDFSQLLRSCEQQEQMAAALMSGKPTDDALPPAKATRLAGSTDAGSECHAAEAADMQPQPGASDSSAVGCGGDWVSGLLN